MIRWRPLSFLTILPVCGLVALFVAAGSAYAEPPDQSGSPSPKEKRLQWVTENGRQGTQDRRALQMSREERRALRRELHESRKELRPHRRERPERPERPGR